MNEDHTSDFSLTEQSPAKKKGSTFDQQLDLLSAEGKFEDIFEQLLPEQREHHDPKKIFRYLRRALQVASGEDFQEISTRFLRLVFAFNAQLTMRLQLGVAQHLDALSDFDQDPKHFLEDGTDVTLGYWRDMVLLNCELIRTIAATDRQWALAKKASRSAQDLAWHAKPHLANLTKVIGKGNRPNGNAKQHGDENVN